MHFSFRGRRGKEISATSYASKEVEVQGTSLGVKVMVEVTEAQPASARLVGMRSHPYGWASGWVCLFPLLGLLVAGYRAAHGVRELDLMSHGKCARQEGARDTADHVIALGSAAWSAGAASSGHAAAKVALTFEYSLPAEQSVPTRLMASHQPRMRLPMWPQRRRLQHWSVVHLRVPPSCIPYSSLARAGRHAAKRGGNRWRLRPGALLLLVAPGAALVVNLLCWMGGFARV